MSKANDRKYIVIWAVLAAALGISLALGMLSPSPLVVGTIFAIAALKAGMVVAWYMHLSAEGRLIKLLVGGTVLVLVALFVGVYPDVANAWSVAAPQPAAGPRDEPPALAAGHPGRGERVFLTYCVGCHQPDGRGMNGKLAADFVGDPGRLAKPDAALTRSIKAGMQGKIGAMPPWGAVLKDQQVVDVIAFLRARFGAGGSGSGAP